jgi:hypothetical protein
MTLGLTGLISSINESAVLRRDIFEKLFLLRLITLVGLVKEASGREAYSSAAVVKASSVYKSAVC